MAGATTTVLAILTGGTVIAKNVGLSLEKATLQNAASVASLMLTTDCMVADLPEDKKGGAPDMGMGGGGMGGMGDMGF